MKASAEQKKSLLIVLDKKAKDFQTQQQNNNVKSNHYFTLMKQLTLLVYFTSEVVGTKVLRYVPVPGKFEGCIDYKRGERIWATS